MENYSKGWKNSIILVILLVSSLFYSCEIETLNNSDEDEFTEEFQ